MKSIDPKSRRGIALTVAWGFWPVALLLFGVHKQAQKRRFLCAREELARKRKQLDLVGPGVSPGGRSHYLIPVYEDAEARQALEREVCEMDAFVRAEAVGAGRY